MDLLFHVSVLVSLSVSLCALNPANLNKRESTESAPLNSTGAPFTGRSDYSIDLQCS